MPLRLLLAVTWSLAEASPSRTQLRGSSNATVNLQPMDSARGAHLVWRDWQTSFCLSSDGNQIRNGVKIQLWQCDQTWRSGGQNFHLDISGRIRMYQDPKYCVVIDGDEYTSGAGIQLQECEEANRNQLWSFSYSGKIRAWMAPTQMCLAVDGNKAVNGAEVQLRACGSSETAGGPEQWLRVALGRDGRAAYAVPDEDAACAAPFEPVSESTEACVAAAEAMEPGLGCHWPGVFLPWARALNPVDRPSWPKGCFFYSACQGGCSLDFNPNGTGPSCPTQGDCMSISVICQLPLP